MDFSNYLIAVCAGLILVSILAGLVSSRVGAPLLLVFLALGMLAGEDGLGIDFDNFQVAYTIGKLSLAIVLFDGGLRTSAESLRTASWPALALATVGVVLTALLTGVAAHWLFGMRWIESLLVGSIVASTDAAAVFFLLRLQGTNLVRRVRATLEAESGLNDPMAIFLTVACVEWLASAPVSVSWQVAGDLALEFLLQIVGGGIVGIIGAYFLVELINRVRLSAGLYPVAVLAGALLIFGLAQMIGASGFMAAYLGGFVFGNRRHRARQLIDRFLDGVAWLSQIVMFVMLGLLVTPSQLVQSVIPALVISVVLIVIVRPLAVMGCLLPFRVAWREQAFISWVGLRGAIPIFLGTIPVLLNVPEARSYFDLAFMVVLTSLVIQGWTVNFAARLLNLSLPPESGPPLRFDIDLPEDVGRDMAVFAVQEGGAAMRLRAADLALGPGVEVVGVVREGAMHHPVQIGRLAPGDQVLVLAPEDMLVRLDRLFGAAPPEDRRDRMVAVLGEFSFGPDVNIGELAGTYGFPVPATDRGLTVSEFLNRHLRKAANPGDRLRLGPVEMIVQSVEEDRIVRVGIELDPVGATPLSRDNFRIWGRHLIKRLCGALATGRRRP